LEFQMKPPIGDGDSRDKEAQTFRSGFFFRPAPTERADVPDPMGILRQSNLGMDDP
jgi:hypothetical protein